MHFIKKHLPLLLVLAAAGLLALIPVFNAYSVIGDGWRGVPQNYGDEILYYNQVHEVADGNFWYGNQYLLEHSKGPTLVIFAGHWLAAIPMLLGMPFVPALVLDFIFWSMVFVALAYWLFRELFLSKWLSSLSALYTYVTVYGLVFRVSSRQEVYPFFLLFYIALARFLKKSESRASILFLGLATGATFYIFSYLWQAAVITLGLLFLYALYLRQWPLVRSTLLASALGGILGLPQLLYMAYLAKTYPYFMESISRFGLVNTHLPMAEVVYSGGWVGVLLLLGAVAYWRLPSVREQGSFLLIVLFAAVTGLGLWIMQGSNVVTGKLLETGEHIRPFIGPWIVLVGAPLLFMLWRRKGELRGWTRALVLVLTMALLFGSLLFVRTYFYPFFTVNKHAEQWRENQNYAAPLQWIDEQQQESVVIWSDPHGLFAYYVPSLSRDYVLYSQGALWTLTTSDEIQERYLVANYFNGVTVATLKTNLEYIVGRQDMYHKAKTIERGVKLCRILFFWDKSHDCGATPTSAELLGDAFFSSLEQKFRQDIVPNIKTYLQKYHVSYIVQDVARDTSWHPEEVGAVVVWSDPHYIVYRLSTPQ